ncbi:hypothetical protein Arub01_41830 [Actinomadura rubrobrunea]|uniref:Uncharacterized protein n=1 Tax=Actinomadura rubrobrunea TaxID=115335 RepID=A0A9W6PWW8_9ACTN|nr:hypothetical protein [Actinomadura rubrobrunea]GLW65939.1 hypothetical protein Arub01_41830 [Actinomadura rubrobrunea]
MTNQTDSTSPAAAPSVRRQIIDGLRALADLLETDPALPVNDAQMVVFPPPGTSDAAAVAMVDQVAERLGVTVSDDRPWGGHYDACKHFGGGWVTYSFVHIPARVAAEHRARDSYHDNIIVTHKDTPTDHDDQRAALAPPVQRWRCCHCGGTGVTSDGATCPHCDGLGHS